MRVRKLGLSVWLCLAWMTNPHLAWALYHTPTWDRGIVHNSVEWNATQSGANVLGEALEALESQGYFLFYSAQDTLSGAGETTLDFFSNLQEPYGALSVFTHGTGPPVASGLPMIEFFWSASSANAALVAANNAGLIDGPAGEAFVTPVKVKVKPEVFGTDSLQLYATVIAVPGLQRLSQPRSGIIHLLVCDGADRYADWTTSGTATMAGYLAQCAVPPAATESDAFWSRLHGLDGSRSRTFKEAISITSMARIPASSGDSLVLAPWIIDVHPPQLNPPYLISGQDQAYVAFDTKMHVTEASADSGIRVGGLLRFEQEPVWEQDTTSTGFSYSDLDYRLSPTAGGIGTVTIYGSTIRSEGGIPLNSGTIHPQHQLTPHDTLVYVYRTAEVPIAVGFDRLLAENGPGGNTISFTTNWEQYADSFSVERMSGGVGTAITPTFSASGSGGPGAYQVFDSQGTLSSSYQVVERQSGGRSKLRYEVIEARSPVNVIAQESIAYDQDSLAIEVDAAGNPGTEVVEGQGPGFYVLLAPDSLTSSLGAYKNLWEAFDVDVGIVPLSDTVSHGGIAAYIHWAYDHGTRYVLLVGDANDAVWWDDPNRWVNGWKWPRVNANGPHLPSQPLRNLLPTNYTADIDSPAVALSFYTPYYATDLPYADIDGNGTPDVRIGRLPVDSRNEIIAYTAKLGAYLLRDIPSGGPFDAIMTCGRDNGRVVGRFVVEDADTVAAVIPGWMPVDRITATNESVWEYNRREFVADSVANSGPDRIVWISSGAQRDIYANFWRLDFGWNMTHLQPPPTDGRFFISLGFACGMGNFDQTENYTVCDSVGSGTANCTGPVRPIPERLLLDPERGAIAVVGPTRGTFQRGNALFSRELTKRLITEGRDLGTAFMMAQSVCLTKYPSYANLIRSYVLLGDPMLGGPTITAVAEAPSVLRPGLGAARPNPFNPSTILPVTVASAGRVRLRIFDAQGRLVRTLLNDELLRAGVTPVRWDGRNQAGNSVASGVYLAKMDAAGASFRRKLVLLK